MLRNRFCSAPAGGVTRATSGSRHQQAAPPGTCGQVACRGAACRAFGGDQAAPDTVLADIPVPQRQRQALGAHHAGGAHGDRGGRLLAGFVYLHTDREPLVGIQAATRATGVPDNPHPQRPIGAWDGHRWIRWPTGARSTAGAGRPVIRRCWGPRNSICFLTSQSPRHRGRPGRQRSCHAPLASRAGTGLTIAAGSECRLLPMGATGPPHSVAVRPPGWRWSHPRGTRWYASGCRTGGHALGRSGADAECCGRAADSQPLTVRPPRPRKAAAASAASMTGTSRIARILTPGAYVNPAPLAARPSRLRRVSRWRQYRSGHDRDSSCSSRGISWALVSFVNVANINLRRGSPACSECSIRPRTRSWRAGRLIKSAPDRVPRRGTDLGRSESSSSPPLRRGDWRSRRRHPGRYGRTLPLAPPAARPGLVGGKRARTVSLTPCWCPQRPTSYVWWAHRSSRGELAQPPGWQRRSQQRARRCGYPVPPRACGIRRSRRGRSLGRSAGPTRAKNMCPPKPARGLASIGRRTVPRCARVSAGDMVA